METYPLEQEAQSTHNTPPTEPTEGSSIPEPIPYAELDFRYLAATGYSRRRQEMTEGTQ